MHIIQIEKSSYEFTQLILLRLAQVIPISLQVKGKSKLINFCFSKMHRIVSHF